MAKKSRPKKDKASIAERVRRKATTPKRSSPALRKADRMKREARSARAREIAEVAGDFSNNPILNAALFDAMASEGRFPMPGTLVPSFS